MTVASPTSSEVMRRLDEVVTELRRLADTLEDGYVRKDVLAEMNTATGIQIAGLEDEQTVVNRRIDRMQDAMDRNRRLIIASFLAPIIVGLVLYVLASVALHPAIR